ncbi:protein eva-1-like isoform X1 [Haliotis cracherodii]|uniref:protein eva-1-like isoform X1 n=1 Tax=Haliotis cracherodii TaxID=6455 RepID=UPI0039E85A09
MVSCTVIRIFTLAAFLGRVALEYRGYNGGSLSSTLDTFHQHTCDGESMTVKCPQKTIISIQFAQYGRQVPSSEMCPAAAPLHRDVYGNTYRTYRNYRSLSYRQQEDTNCQATTSLQVLLDLCQNRHSCHLVASAKTFGQDPCPETSKYLEVAYKCQPDGYESQVVCQGEQMVLWCKRSTRVAIYSAMFGRTPNGTNVCEYSGPRHIDCQARNTVEAVRSKCHGRKQCVLEAEEYIFGNPCEERVNKYLNVTYTCVPKKIFKAAHRKERRRHHKKKDRKNSLRSSSTEAGVFTKYSETSTPTYKTSRKAITVRPEQASADAAGSDKKSGEGNPSTVNTDKKPGEGNPSTVNTDKETPIKDKTKPTETSSSTANPCDNYTTVPAGQQRDRSMGILMNWLNAVNFLNKNAEKVILYLVLGVCVGIIILLTVILIKIGRDYKRNVRAKLDVTEPTHSHNVTSNHHPLEASSIERAESIDRIEVVRFSPRGTLRNDTGTRSLSNYYG